MEFSKRIKELRKQKEITLQEAADGIRTLTGAPMTKGQLSKYENGSEKCSLSNAVAIAFFFGCSVDYLIGLTDDPKIKSMDRMLTYIQKFKEFREKEEQLWEFY